jgi:hypothetical protein
MGNHYHLLLETPEPNLVSGMKWPQGTYTQRYNARHRKRGHLFQGRYRAVPEDSQSGQYFQTVNNCIHFEFLHPSPEPLLDAQHLGGFCVASRPRGLHQGSYREEGMSRESLLVLHGFRRCTQHLDLFISGGIVTPAQRGGDSAASAFTFGFAFLKALSNSPAMAVTGKGGGGPTSRRQPAADNQSTSVRLNKISVEWSGPFGEWALPLVKSQTR